MLKIKINKKDIEIVENDFFVRGTVGAKVGINSIDEYWLSEEHFIEIVPIDTTTQEQIDIIPTYLSINLMFKRYDITPIKVVVFEKNGDELSLSDYALSKSKARNSENEPIFVLDVPHEVMSESGSFKIGFFFTMSYTYTDSNGNVVESVSTTPTLWSENISVKNGTDTDGTTPTQYTPTELEQLNGKIATVDSKLNDKQDTLTAGKNITIKDNVISASQDLSNYATLKTKQADFFLKLDDLSSQDTIAELNLTDGNNEISKNGVLMIIDSEDEITNATKSTLSQDPWNPTLKAFYANGDYERISTVLIGDSTIKYIELSDIGVDSCSLKVNLQDGVEYSIQYRDGCKYNPDEEYPNYRYTHYVDYFFIVPSDSITAIKYTKGVWDSIKNNSTVKNMLNGKPIYFFDENSRIEVKYIPCSQYIAMKDYVSDTVDELKEEVVNSDEINNIKENLSTLTDNISLLSSLINAKTITTVGVNKDCKYTFDWNAMYFFKSNTGNADVTLLDSDGNNIIGSLKCSYGLLILPEASYVRSEWTSKYDPSDPNYNDGKVYVDGNRKEDKLHGLFAGMTDKTAIITTDKIQMLQFDLDPDKTVSITPVDESVIVYKIKL